MIGHAHTAKKVRHPMVVDLDVGPPDPVPQWVQDLIDDKRRQRVEIPEELQRRLDRLRPVIAEQVKAHADEIAESLLTYGSSWQSLKGEAVVTVEDTTRLLVRPGGRTTEGAESD